MLGTGLVPDMFVTTMIPIHSLGSQDICEMKPSIPPPCCTSFRPR